MPKYSKSKSSQVQGFLVYTVYMNPPRYSSFLFFFALFLLPYQIASSPVFNVEDLPVETILIEKVEEPNTILFLGDIMLGRYVEKKMEQYGDEYSFQKIQSFLASSAYVVANLEGPIPVIHVPTPSQKFQFSFKARVAPLLSRMNISALSLANNHGDDWGKDGWLNTKKVLNSSSIKTFGYSQTTIDDIYEISIDGKTVVVFGINMVVDRWDSEKAIEVTKQVRALHPEAYLIAFLHWGNEYTHNQNKYQIDFAHSLIDNGVSAVLGTHPHVIQGIEVYKEKLIFYSLGNFIFDQYFSQDVQDGYVVKMKNINNQIIFELIPYVSEVSQPKVADEVNKKRILEYLADISSEALRDTIRKGIIETIKYNSN